MKLFKFNKKQMITNPRNHNEGNCSFIVKDSSTKVTNYLSTESLAEVGVKRTLAGEVLDVATIVSDLAVGASLNEFFAGQLGETPVLGDNDLLLTRELVLAASKSFNDSSLVAVLGADREDDLTNVDTGYETVGLTEGTTHTGLQSRPRC
jgi:hypothetical protein